MPIDKALNQAPTLEIVTGIPEPEMDIEIQIDLLSDTTAASSLHALKLISPMLSHCPAGEDAKQIVGSIDLGYAT